MSLYIIRDTVIVRVDVQVVRITIPITVQRIRKRIVVPIQVGVFYSIQDTIIVIIDVHHIRNTIPIGIRIIRTVRIQVIRSAVLICIVIGRVTVSVCIFIRSVDAVSVIINIAVVYILCAVCVRKVVGRIVDLIVYIKAVVYIAALVAIVQSVTISICTCKVLVRNTVEVKVVPLIIVRHQIIVRIGIQVVYLVRAICIDRGDAFITRSLVSIVQSVIVTVISRRRDIACRGLSLYIIRDTVIVRVDVPEIGISIRVRVYRIQPFASTRSAFIMIVQAVTVTIHTTGFLVGVGFLGFYIV